MRLFLTLAEGESATTAETIWASCDPQLISILARAICRRMGAEPPGRLSDLSHRRRGEPERGIRSEAEDLGNGEASRG